MQGYSYKLTQNLRASVAGMLLIFATACSTADPIPEKRDTVAETRVVNPKTPVKQPCIALLPFGNFNEVDTARLRNAIATFYHTEVIWRPAENLPANAWYEPRQRYKADSIIEYLQANASFNMKTLVGLTGKDISTTKGDNPDYGIFGLGFMPGKGCVISTYRLKKGIKNEEHFYQRTLKVVLHEIGHNYGLEHCTSGYSCLMQDAEGTIKTVDEERVELCESCMRKLNMN